MKYSLLRPAGWLCLSVGLCLPGAPTQAVGVSSLPSDWYRLPEDIAQATGSAGGAFTSATSGDLQGVERQLGRLMDVQLSTLEKLGQRPPSAWAVTGATFDFGVSMNGLVGGLFGDGVSAASAYWKKRGTLDSADQANRQRELTNIEISDTFTKAQLEAALEPAARLASATISEKQPGLIKKHLIATAQDFLEVARQLRAVPEARWRVSQYIMDFGVDAAGKVVGIKAGVEVRLRLIWNRRAGAPDKNEAPPPEGLKNLVRFVREISRDLEGVGTEAVTRQGYKLSKFGVGIGINAGGEVVVVKGLARTQGRLFFTPDGSGTLEALGVSDDEPFSLALEGGSPGLKFALADEDPCKKSGGIFAPPGNPFEEFSCKVNRKQFRDGMLKAVRMAAIFAKMAPKKVDAPWELYRIRTNFELSVSGQWYMPWLKGLASMDMEFVRDSQLPSGLAVHEETGSAGLPTGGSPGQGVQYPNLPSQWPDLQNFLGHSLQVQSRVMHEERTASVIRNVPEFPEYQSWDYNQFQFKVRGTVGMSLHWLLKGELLPEVETVWTRNHQ